MAKIQAHLSDDCGLNKAVKRVFEHKAVGETNIEVSQLLFKSIKTIERQTTDYLTRMDCKNTSEAVAKATAEGWLTFKLITKTLLLMICINTAFYSMDDDSAAIRAKLSRGHQRLIRSSKDLTV